ncbi:MAG: GGDEF domain-containing protein, partial [Gammaproteobacteria bacterium]|nr:GGDEF domain-containing protein [Gammaproteobacteria bacterium]
NNLERFRSWIFPVAFLMPVFAGICMGTMVMIALQNDFSKPYEGMLVAIFYAFFFCRLLTYEAAFSSFLITLCYLSGLYAVEAPGDIISHHGIYLVTFMIVGIGAAGSLERSIRSTFLTSRLINEFAERDSLTGLNNRHYFDHAYKELIRTANKDGKSIGVMMMDIDHFKAVNDGEGHQAGDNVIRRTGKGLAQGCLRKPALLARYGGDEFVAVWVGNSKADIESSIESMRKHCADLNKGVTTSAGLAWLYPPADPEYILEEADKALYGAKENGRNQLFSSAKDKATD